VSPRQASAIFADAGALRAPPQLRLLNQGNRMRTKKQSAASRRNARKSTGPKTPEGKATASMNALRHGLRARRAILPDEHPEDFSQIHDGLQDLYQPQNQAEQYLVDQAALAQWKLVRAENFEADCYADEPSPKGRAAILDRMSQLECRLDRAYTKAYKELERIKAARQKPAELPKEPPKQPPKEKPKEKSKEEKEMDDMGGPNLDVFWVDPETGVRDYLYRRRDGKALPRDAQLPPTTKDDGG
jgi:hypothetical protein